MTVAAQTPSISYAGNGITTVFAAPFRYIAPADLRVLLRASNGSETVLALGTGFTATSGNTNAGGSVTLTAAPADGTTVVISRQTARTQPADYITSGAFTAESHEEALDRAMLVNQEQDQDIVRGVKVPVGELGFQLPSSDARARGLLRFDGAGGAIALPLDELVALAGNATQAGITEVFTQSFGPRSQVTVFHPPGVDPGGYFVEFSPQADIPFVRAYARVFSGTGTVDVRVLGSGVLWTAAGVGVIGVDQVVDLTLPAGADLIVVLENIVGDVSGVVVFLEGAAE